MNHCISVNRSKLISQENFRMQVFKHIIYTLASLMSILCSIDVNAQEIKVKSFSLQMEPMTVPMQRKDNNGEICALVKVILPSKQAAFEGNLIGDCDFKTSEYWCYLSPGSKYLKIKYPGTEPLLVNFENYIGTGLKSRGIYELAIEVPIQNHMDATFTIKGEIKKESPNEEGLYGKKMPYKPGYTIYKNYKDGKYEGKWPLKYASYTVSGICIGDSLTAIAEDSRYKPQTIVIDQKKIGNTDFNFYLEKKRIPLVGRLIDADTGEPLAGV